MNYIFLYNLRIFILQCQKAKNNFQIILRAVTSIVLIVFDGVLCEVCAYTLRSTYWPLWMQSDGNTSHDTLS
jgi:hypothetical protein